MTFSSLTSLSSSPSQRRHPLQQVASPSSSSPSRGANNLTTSRSTPLPSRTNNSTIHHHHHHQQQNSSSGTTPPNLLFHALHVTLSRQKRCHLLLQSQKSSLQEMQMVSSELLRKGGVVLEKEMMGSSGSGGSSSGGNSRGIRNGASNTGRKSSFQYSQDRIADDSQQLHQPHFRNSNSFHSNGLFGASPNSARGNKASSNGNSTKSNNSSSNALIQKRLAHLKRHHEYVQHLSLYHQNLCLLSRKIRFAVLGTGSGAADANSAEFASFGNLQNSHQRRQALLHEILDDVKGQVGKCEACFRELKSDTSKKKHGIRGTNSRSPTSNHTHQESTTSTHLWTCNRCHLSSFCHNPECIQQRSYHHDEKSCLLLAQLYNLDIMELDQITRGDSDSNKEELIKYQNETEKKVKDQWEKTTWDSLEDIEKRRRGKELMRDLHQDSPSQSGSSPPVAASGSHSDTPAADTQPDQDDSTLSNLNAHREYVAEHILKKHNSEIHSSANVKVMNELHNWASQARAEVSKFLRTEQERQNREELNHELLKDDLERINSFLSASLYQREHFLSETDNSSVKSVLDSPLQEFYSTNFKESNPDFVLQFRLIQMVLQLREKLQVSNKHSTQLTEKVSSLEKKLSTDKKRHQKQLTSRDETIEELKQKNRALKMNFDNLQEKFHQALVFSKKRSKKIAPTSSAQTQTDSSVTHRVLSNAARQVTSLKQQLKQLREGQLKRDAQFEAHLTSMEQEMISKASDMDTRAARTNLALQQARAKLRGGKYAAENFPSAEIQTDPVDNMKSMCATEERGVQAPDMALPLLKTRSRSSTMNVTTSDLGSTASLSSTVGDVGKLKSLEINPDASPSNKRKRAISVMSSTPLHATGGKTSPTLNVAIPNTPVRSDSTISFLDTNSSQPLSKSLSNIKYSRYLSYASRDHATICQKMAQDNWCLFLKMSRLQIIADQLSLESEFINFDVDLRAKMMLRLYERARTYLQCWKARRELYIRLRLRLEKAFKVYMVKTTSEFQNQTSSGDSSKSSGRKNDSSSKHSGGKRSHASYEDVVSQLSLFLPDSYEKHWYNLSSGYKRNVRALVENSASTSLNLLSKREKLRIDALAVFWKYNFSTISLDTRRRILSQLCEYVKMGEKESEDEKKELLSRITKQIENDHVEEVAGMEDNMTPEDAQQQGGSSPAVVSLASQRSQSTSAIPRSGKVQARTFVQKTLSHNASNTFKLASLPEDNSDPDRLKQKKKLERHFENDIREMVGAKSVDGNDEAEDGNEVGQQSAAQQPSGEQEGDASNPSESVNNAGSGNTDDSNMTFSKMRTERRDSIPTALSESNAEMANTSGKTMKTNLQPKAPVRG